MEVRGGELDGVEQDSSFFRVEPPVQQMFADLTYRSLNGVGVVEAGEEERGGRELAGAAAILYQGAATIKRILEKIKAVAADPYASHYRLRIGDWRVIYELHDDRLELWALEVGPRGGIY